MLHFHCVMIIIIAVFNGRLGFMFSLQNLRKLGINDASKLKRIKIVFILSNQTHQPAS